MNFTKFDRLQLIFNVAMITGTIFNALYLAQVLPRWWTFIGLGLALAACLFVNEGSSRSKNSMFRETVTGSKFLAGLSYVTGAAWLITFGLTVFLRIDQNFQG